MAGQRSDVWAGELLGFCFHKKAFRSLAVAFAATSLSIHSSTIAYADEPHPNRALELLPAQVLPFNFPPQPLAKSLRAFSQTTGIEILVNSAFVAAKTAPPLKGAMNANDALRNLLLRAGLEVRQFSDTAVILYPVPARPASGSQLEKLAAGVTYYAVLQTAVSRALCRNETTAPGRYRLAVSLWMGPSGNISRVKPLGTTGEDGLDQAITATLEAVEVGLPPPAGLPQPLAVLIGPKSEAGVPPCLPPHQLTEIERNRASVR